MILVPTIGMVVMGALAGDHRWHERDTSAAISAEADRMYELMIASNIAWRESVPALSLAIAAEMGVGPERLIDLYDVDLLAMLADARAAVDANHVLQTEPTLDDGLRALLADRAAIDAGTLSSVRASIAFDTLNAAIDDLWQSARQRLEATIDAGSIAGNVLQRIEVLRASHEAFVAGSSRIGSAKSLALSEPGASVRDLIDANARVDAATSLFVHQLSGQAAAAFRTFDGDPAARQFDDVVDVLIADTLAGRTSPLAADGVAFGAAFIDGVAWLDGSARLVVAASADLGDLAAADAAEQSASFWWLMVIAGLAFVVSMIAVALVSRSFTRPLDRIATVVEAVRDGAFDIPRVAPHGPRELAAAVHAVNDMAASIDESSHDAITGLLNRRAALDTVARDLARAVRDEVRVMAIFLDVDGLKRINDTHGHQAGDRALALVAEALHQTCRDGDVVARIGGDEFLVSGMLRSDVAAIESLADRIRESVGRSVLWCDDIPVSLACSVGVAVSELGSTDVEALIADADTAMYRMKVASRAA